MFALIHTCCCMEVTCALNKSGTAAIPIIDTNHRLSSTKPLQKTTLVCEHSKCQSTISDDSGLVCVSLEEEFRQEIPSCTCQHDRCNKDNSIYDACYKSMTGRVHEVVSQVSVGIRIMVYISW